MKQRGFTLFELLVALAIFAMLGAMAYGGLASILDNNSGVAAQAERLAQWQKAMLLIEEDMHYLAPRTIRDEYGDLRPAFSLPNDGGERVLEFSRLAYPNPGHVARSELVRVAYVKQQDRLERWMWWAADHGSGQPDRKQLLFAGVDGLDLGIWDEALNVQPIWPPLGSPVEARSTLPRAVDVRITLHNAGELRRLLEVVQP